MVFTNPCRREWKKRQPEQKMKVGPKNGAADPLRRLEEMMMVVPIDAHVNVTQHVTQQYRQHWFQCIKLDLVRHLEFQDHDRDNDGEYSVAERFEPGCFHVRVRTTSKRRATSTS